MEHFPNLNRKLRKRIVGVKVSDVYFTDASGSQITFKFNNGEVLDIWAIPVHDIEPELDFLFGSKED